MQIKNRRANKVDPSNPDTIPKFVDELPIPPAARPPAAIKGKKYYEIAMKQVRHRYHRDFPTTPIWGYDGMHPGPTIKVKQNEKIYVRWKNKLPGKHLLPIDRTLHESAGPPDVRTVVHLHGANVDWESDGHPEPGMVTSVIMKFTEHPGEYVWHCHILEHEDYDMMRPMRVVERE